MLTIELVTGSVTYYSLTLSYKPKSKKNKNLIFESGTRSEAFYFSISSKLLEVEFFFGLVTQSVIF